MTRVPTPAPLPAVCSRHEWLERTMDELTVTTKSGFAHIHKLLTEMRVEGARRETALEASLKAAWHEIRDEQTTRLRHEADCPARRRAMRRAEKDSSDDIDASAFRGEPSQIVELPGGKMVEVHRQGSLIRNTANGHYEIPRPVLWVGALIGAAVAASGYVLHLLAL